MTESINILTYNTKMLPGIFGKNNEKRAELIFDELSKADSQYDIICFQEVFDEDSREIFDRKLKSINYNTIPYSSDNDWFNEDSGLFFASRYDILAHKFSEFNDSQPLTADWLTDKGILGTALKITDEIRLVIINTHLQSSESFNKVREKQLDQIRRFITRTLDKVKNKDKTGVLILGDLNIIGDIDQEYNDMKKFLGYHRDLFREINPDDIGYTWDGTENSIIKDDDPDDKDKQRLDYILSYDKVPQLDDNSKSNFMNKINCLSSKVIKLKTNGFDLSDHYGVEAVIRLA